MNADVKDKYEMRYAAFVEMMYIKIRTVLAIITAMTGPVPHKEVDDETIEEDNNNKSNNNNTTNKNNQENKKKPATPKHTSIPRSHERVTTDIIELYVTSSSLSSPFTLHSHLSTQRMYSCIQKCTRRILGIIRLGSRLISTSSSSINYYSTRHALTYTHIKI